MNTIIVALKHEAHPIIETNNLTLSHHSPFKIYENRYIRIVLSGVGQQASYAATKFALEDKSKCFGVWINFGVAGHRHLPPGTAVVISKVTDNNTTRTWYPAVKRTSQHLVKQLITHDKIVTDYPTEACCDMEAAGFMAAVSETIACEHIHVLKIISDNVDSSVHVVTKQSLRSIVKENLIFTENYIKEAEKNLVIYPPNLPDNASQIFEKWHFTFTENQQLLDLYRSFRAICPENEWPSVEINKCASARDVIENLKAHIVQLSPKL